MPTAAVVVVVVTVEVAVATVGLVATVLSATDAAASCCCCCCGCGCRRRRVVFGGLLAADEALKIGGVKEGTVTDAPDPNTVELGICVLTETELGGANVNTGGLSNLKNGVLPDTGVDVVSVLVVEVVIVVTVLDTGADDAFDDECLVFILDGIDVAGADES